MSLRLLLTFIVSLFILATSQCQDSNFNIKTMNSTNRKNWDVVSDLRRQLVLKIRGNASTGANWYLSKPSSSALVVITPINVDTDGTSNEFIVGESGDMISGEGYAYFRFTPLSTGKAKLRFVYKDNNETFNTMIVNVTIK
jgi:hypothetical protein